MDRHGCGIDMDMVADLTLPTREELMAWRLRTEQNLPDAEVARLLRISRETANRRIARAQRKIDALRVALADGAGDPLERLLGAVAGDAAGAMIGGR